MRAVVFGGSGFIGTHLTRYLLSRGDEVLVADLVEPAAGDYAYCDVRRNISVPWQAADTVFNLAAVHRTPGHPDHEYYDTNVGGAINVTRWCRAANVDSLVFTSSISVYGPTEEFKDEMSETRPTSAYGRSKLLAEMVHEEWAQAAGRRLLIARPAVVFGAGEQGNFTRLASALRRRRFAYLGRRDTVKACGYVSDLVRTFDFFLKKGSTNTKFNFCYPTPYTIEQICEAFYVVAGYPLPRALPEPVVDISLGLLQRLPSTRHHDLFNPERLRKVLVSTNIAPTVLTAAGFTWETDLVSGLRAWRADSGSGGFS